MRVAFAILIILSLVLVIGAGAMAGDYHTDAKLKCYQCHVMHATKSHAYTDDSHDASLGGAVTSYDKLLKDEDLNALCLECHNEGDSKDVYGLADGVLKRAAGSFLGDATDAYAAVASPLGHDLGVDATPPGGSGSMALDCVSCHEPHGNAYFRNLKDLGGGGVTYAKVTNDTTKDVFESASGTHDAANVSYNRLSGGVSHYEAFCTSCHSSIHSGDTVGGDWLKHPTVGFSRSYTLGTVSPLKTLGGTPIAGQTGDPIAGDVSCVTCHKGHGSTRTFGLIYDNRTTPAIEDTGSITGLNDAAIRVTCKHCHAKGLTATE